MNFNENEPREIFGCSKILGENRTFCVGASSASNPSCICVAVVVNDYNTILLTKRPTHTSLTMAGLQLPKIHCEIKL